MLDYSFIDKETGAYVYTCGFLIFLMEKYTFCFLKEILTLMHKKISHHKTASLRGKNMRLASRTGEYWLCAKHHSQHFYILI